MPFNLFAWWSANSKRLNTAAALTSHSFEWRHLLARVPLATVASHHAQGFLEGAVASEYTGEGVVYGWVAYTPDSLIWLEDDAGHSFTLETAFWSFRPDIQEISRKVGQVGLEQGFVMRITGLKPGSKLWLKTISQVGAHVLAEITCGSLSVHPVAAAQLLFGIGCPLVEFHRRVGAIDEPMLRPLIHNYQAACEKLSVEVKSYGDVIDQPMVSVIIPLFGRIDFVEHQLIEFVQDTWLRSNAEILYVVDDPNILEAFKAQAVVLHDLYKLPFTLVWGGANRGFSSANNLGVKIARGDYLVFLNSDVFPQKPGWAEALIDVLQSRSDVGAVGPRLVYGDGSIQHAGMRFIRRDELGVWVNHHPFVGLEPSLDRQNALSIVPAITGACIALRRQDFERVGGWDAGYLIGDFEDSDLCLKLRQAGLKVVYLPTVQLIHLERQSFKLLGQSDFRTRVTIFNAVRHQNRWRHFLEVEEPNT